MWLIKLTTFLLLFVFPNVLSVLPISHKLIYTKELTDEMYDAFIQSNSLTAVYYFKKDFYGFSHFLKEVEKSAAILTIYDTWFGILDCTTYPKVEQCDITESETYVYLFRNGNLLLDISIDSLFSIDSIISNVLQVCLSHQAPILQSVSELEKLQADNQGFSDVIFSYQYALGTYDHRILMEVIFVFQNNYQFGISNEQDTVKNLPHYSSAQKSGIWVMRCKSVSSFDKQCPAFKFQGAMERSVLAKFFRALELPSVHDIGRDGDFNPYENNEVDIVYIFYDGKSESNTKELVTKFTSEYTSLMGLITINVDEVDTKKYTYDKSLKLPLLAIKKTGETDLIYQQASDTPIDFVMRELNFSEVQSEVIMQTPSITTDTQDGIVEDIPLEMELQQDDYVAQLAYETVNIPINRTHLPALTDKTFFPETNDKPLLMVLFYLTFDPRNQMTLRIFANAAEILASRNHFPLAAIECYDWTDVCQKVNISYYPTILVYQAGMGPVHYGGPLSVSSIVATASLYIINSPLMLSTMKDVSLFVSGELPERLKDVTDVAVLGTFGADSQLYMDTYKAAAKKLHGLYICGLVVNSISESVCQSYGFNDPCIIAFKRHDLTEPHTLVTPANSIDILIENINLALLPVLPELTAETFPKYLAMKKPFVILFTSSRSSEYFQLISSVSVYKHIQDIIFGWMNVSPSISGAHSVGKKILSHYIQEPEPEELIAINHLTGEVHRFSESVISQDSVMHWLNAVIRGEIMTSMRLTEHEWRPRLPGYNFLKKIDEEAAQRAPEDEKHSYIREINEHGLGVFQHLQPEMGELNFEKEIQAEFEQLKLSRLYQGQHSASWLKAADHNQHKISGINMPEKMEEQDEMLIHHAEL